MNVEHNTAVHLTPAEALKVIKNLSNEMGTQICIL
jgi:hypothetical protein